VPGRTSVGSTSPLYTLLLSVGYVLRVPFFIWTFALGALALAGAGWIGRRLGDTLFPDLRHAGLWTGLAIVTAWHLIWAAASGMETILFGTLSIAVVGLAWRERARSEASDLLPNAFRRGFTLGLVGAALTLTRPEGMGLVGLAGFLTLLAWPCENARAGWRVYLAWGSGVAAAWLLGVVPYAALNYDVSGTLLPDTARAKQAEYSYLKEQWSLAERYGRLFLPLVAGGLIMLLPGASAGLHDVARRARQDRREILFLLPVAWAVIDLSAYAIRLPANYQHGRYVMPILPHLMLYGVGGTLAILRSGRRAPSRRVVSRSLGLSAVLVTIGFWWIGAQQYGRDARIINTEMVDTAKWVARNLPPDDLLAVHDIGAVGYYAPRPILDLAGLVSPEVVPIMRDDEARMRLMCERDVAYLMVFPDQLPTAPDDPRLGTEMEYDPQLGRDVAKPVFVTNAPYARASGGTNMAVYRLNWPDTCP
jgi:hypothetical protein